jgi:hypothetical protein
MKTIKTFALVLSILVLPMAASAGGIEFAVGGWYTKADGDVSYNTQGGPNDFIDLDSIGAHDKWQVMARAKFQPPMLPGIYLQATPMSFGTNNNGDNSDFQFAFGNTVFFPGDKIESDFYLNEYDAVLYIPIPLLKQGTLGMINIEIGAGARWIWTKTALTNNTAEDEDRLVASLEDSQTSNALYPVGYAALILKPHDKVSIEGEAWGWSWNGDKFWTLNGRLKVLLLGPLYIDGGYREDYYNFSKDDLSIRRAHFKGPYAEIGLQW